MGKKGKLFTIDPNEETNKMARLIYEFAGVKD
jgi:hypothetical protein